jgi:pentatricopeptide repeat protein
MQSKATVYTNTRFFDVMNDLTTFVIFAVAFLILNLLARYLFNFFKTTFLTKTPKKVPSDTMSELYKFNVKLAEEGISPGATPEQFIASMEEQGIHPDITTYNSLIDWCLKKKHFTTAESLLEKVIHSKAPVRPDVVSYNIWLKYISLNVTHTNALISLQKAEEVFALLSQLFQPNAITYNTIIDICVTCEAYDKMKKYFEMMKASNLIPDIYTYSTLIKGIKNCDSTSTNLKEISDRIIGLVEAKAIDYDEILFNSLIDAYCKFRDMINAEAIMHVMANHGVKPSLITYGIIMKAYTTSKNLSKAMEIFSKIKKEGLTPNEITYGCLMECCIRAECPQKVFELYEEMKAEGVPINVVIATTLIKTCSKVNNLELALTIFDSSFNNPDIMPNPIFINTMFETCSYCGNIHKMYDIYLTIKEHQREGNLLDKLSYSILIRRLCKVRETRKALQVFDDMFKAGIVADDIIYNSLLDSTLKCNMIDVSIDIYSKMKQNGVKPTNVTYSILVKIYTKLGNLDVVWEIFEEMKRFKIEMGVIIYTCVIQACIRAKSIDRAIEVFEALRNSGTVFPDQVIYNTIINGCVFAGRLSAACIYLQSSIVEGIVLADDIYNNTLRNILTSKKMPFAAKRQYINSILSFAQINRLMLDEGVIMRLRTKFS